MGNLEPFDDIVGDMSQNDINAANIDNIIDELNRNSDQLDALNNVLSVIAYGSLVYSWDGTGSGSTPTIATLFAPIESTASFIDFTYLTRSSDVTPINYATPYSEAAQNSNGDTVVTKFFVSGSNSDTGQYEVSLKFWAPGTPETFTFYYTIVQQPANIQTS